ncbi:MAG: hypothetical protein HY708_08520, partial [Ignavibacteriae bacterium]|nr:hypothetical protein [Ignavibacteriota bacterium]
VNLSFALFSERDAANTCRSKIVRGASWNDAVDEVQSDSLLRLQLQQVATHQYFTQSTLYPQELWKLARTLTKEEVSFVVRTEVGYYVLISHGMKRQGEIPDLEYVRDEIRERLLIGQRRQKYEQLISNLRAKHTVEVFMDNADTTAAAGE